MKGSPSRNTPSVRASPSGVLPDNVVMIDNPAVSGHHARVLITRGPLSFEDLRSTDGTFVERPAGDAPRAAASRPKSLVGKHQSCLIKSDAGVATSCRRPDEGSAHPISTRSSIARCARRSESRPSCREASQRACSRCIAITPSPYRCPSRDRWKRRAGGIQLDGQTSIIGRSNTALVRLRGWFKPSVAVAIAKTRPRICGHSDGRQAARQPGTARRPARPPGRRHAHGERPRSGICLEGRRSHRIGRVGRVLHPAGLPARRAYCRGD